jgi:hypothetical protein
MRSRDGMKCACGEHFNNLTQPVIETERSGYLDRRKSRSFQVIFCELHCRHQESAVEDAGCDNRIDWMHTPQVGPRAAFRLCSRSLSRSWIRVSRGFWGEPQKLLHKLDILLLRSPATKAARVASRFHGITLCKNVLPTHLVHAIICFIFIYPCLDEPNGSQKMLMKYSRCLYYIIVNSLSLLQS